MNIKNCYLLLFVIGIIVPYWEFINFIIENGFDIDLFYNQLLASRISRFFVYDVVISAVVLLLAIYQDRKNIKMYWLPFVATLIIGVSAGLPLFLYQKELLKNERNSQKNL